MRVVLGYGWRILVAVLALAALSWASLRLQTAGGALGPETGGPCGLLLLTVLREALTVGALLWPTLRSRWSGTQLTCALFVAYFGIHSFVTLSRAFLTMPLVVSGSVAAALSAHGFLIALASATVMVVVMGRMHQEPFVPESPRLHLRATEWLWKLPVCAVAGMALWLAGQVIMPASVRGFYEGAGEPPFVERAVLELGRGLLLVSFVLPIIKTMRGGRWESAAAVGLLVAVLGGVTPVLLPSGFMPAEVRASFIISTAPGNLLYGGLVGYLFSRRPGINSGSHAAGADLWSLSGRGF